MPELSDRGSIQFIFKKKGVHYLGITVKSESTIKSHVDEGMKFIKYRTEKRPTLWMVRTTAGRNDLWNVGQMFVLCVVYDPFEVVDFSEC